MGARNLLAWLWVSGRRRPGPERVGRAAERALAASDDDAVTAALQARTLRRGRVRIEDDSGEMPRRSAPPRGSD